MSYLYNMEVPKWYKINEISLDKYILHISEIYKHFESIHDDFELEDKKEDIFLKKMMMSQNHWSEEDWYKHEKNRILQRNLEMKIGYFHENIASSIRGFSKIVSSSEKKREKTNESHCDIVNYELNEVFELKNKENTMNSDSKKSVFKKLKEYSSKGMKSYLVFINKWTKKNKNDDSIVILSGKEFYNKIAKRDDFYDDLLETITYTFIHYKSMDELLKSINKKSDESSKSD